MLNNRFMRFLTTILMLIAFLVITAIIEPNFKNSEFPTLVLYMTPVFTFGVCMVGQLCGDILNEERCLNNGFMTFLKRAIFFAAAIGLMVGGLGVGISSTDLLKLNILERALCIACMYAPTFALLAYVFAYIKFADKKWYPFFLPISYVAAVLFGLLVSWGISEIPDLEWNGVLFILELVILVAIVVICSNEGTWPFEEWEDDFSYSGYSGSSTTSATTTKSDEGYKRCGHCAYFYSYAEDCYCKERGSSVGRYDFPCNEFKRRR